jgi:hypothetical protein
VEEENGRESRTSVLLIAVGRGSTLPWVALKHSEFATLFPINLHGEPVQINDLTLSGFGGDLAIKKSSNNKDYGKLNFPEMPDLNLPDGSVLLDMKNLDSECRKKVFGDWEIGVFACIEEALDWLKG